MAAQHGAEQFVEDARTTAAATAEANLAQEEATADAKKKKKQQKRAERMARIRNSFKPIVRSIPPVMAYIGCKSLWRQSRSTVSSKNIRCNSSRRIRTSYAARTSIYRRAFPRRAKSLCSYWSKRQRTGECRDWGRDRMSLPKLSRCRERFVTSL